MPGPVVHTIVAEQLPNALLQRDESRFDLSAVAGDAAANRQALVFGAQGPDPLFLNPDDLLFDGLAGWMDAWSTFVANLRAKLWELTAPLREIKEEISDAAQDVLDEMEERSHVVDELTNLQARFKQVMTVMGEIMTGFVKKTVLDKADPFGFYVSPLQTCGRVKDVPIVGDWQQDHELWWWFDVLHTRRTGDFAVELLDIANGETAGADGETEERSLLRSYALGYLSHVAADVTGHAYVNTITGGPYRLNQSQRHTAQEKIMDVWAYDRYYDDAGRDYDLDFSLSDLDATEADRYYVSDELVDSGFHKNFQFTAGEVEPQDWVPDPDRTFAQGSRPPIRATLKLPDEIADNVALAAQRAFDADVFGELTGAEVATAYRYWYKHTWGSTSTYGPVHPDELPGDVDLTGPLKEEIEEFLDELNDVPDAAQSLWDALTNFGSPGTLGDAADCMANVLGSAFGQGDAECLQEAAEAINAYVAQVAAEVANLLSEVFDLWVSIFEIVEAALAIPLRVLNFLLQAAYEKLWALYTNLLVLVSAIGFGTMYSEDLDNPQLQNMWDPRRTDAAGRSARGTIVRPHSEGSGYPRKGMKAGHTVAPEEAERLQGLENDAHLLVPFTEVEQPRTVPGPDVYGENTPEVFIDDPNDVLGADTTFGSELYDALPTPIPNSNHVGKDFGLDDMRAPAPDEEGYDGSDNGFEEPALGDAVSLTVALYKEYEQTGDVPNFNLSGDRAIGYPTWANGAGCGLQRRQRWAVWHGEYVPWLEEPIDPVFVPDLEEHY